MKKFWPTNETTSTTVPPQIPVKPTIYPPNPPTAPPAQWVSPIIDPNHTMDSLALPFANYANVSNEINVQQPTNPAPTPPPPQQPPTQPPAEAPLNQQ